MIRPPRPLRIAALAVLVGGALAAPAIAQSTVNGSTPAPILQDADVADRNFVHDLGQATLDETAIAAFAMRTAKNPAVVALAKRIRDDRRVAAGDLTRAGAPAGFTIPDGPDATVHALQTDLAGKSGAAFDAAFLERAVQADQNAIDLVDREISDGYNPGIVEYAKYRKRTIAAELSAVQDEAAKLQR